MKDPDSFITAKGSVPRQFKTTSTKRKQNDQSESHIIKKLKTSHNSNIIAVYKKKHWTATSIAFFKLKVTPQQNIDILTTTPLNHLIL